MLRPTSSTLIGPTPAGSTHRPHLRSRPAGPTPHRLYASPAGAAPPAALPHARGKKVPHLWNAVWSGDAPYSLPTEAVSSTHTKVCTWPQVPAHSAQAGTFGPGVTAGPPPAGPPPAERAPSPEDRQAAQEPLRASGNFRQGGPVRAALPLRIGQLKSLAPDLPTALKQQHNEDKYLAISATSTTTVYA